LPDPALPALPRVDRANVETQRNICRVDIGTRDPAERGLLRHFETRLAEIERRFTKEDAGYAYLFREGLALLFGLGLRGVVAGVRFALGKAEKEFEEKEAIRSERLRAEDLHAVTKRKVAAETADLESLVLEKLREKGLSWLRDDEGNIVVGPYNFPPAAEGPRKPDVDVDAFRKAALTMISLRFQLTSPEADIAFLVLRGLSDGDIVKQLGENLGAVVTRLNEVFRKLGVSDRAEFIALLDTWDGSTPF
jgi:DNA-binding CsgD family transcriptional regulator